MQHTEDTDFSDLATLEAALAADAAAHQRALRLSLPQAFARALASVGEAPL